MSRQAGILAGLTRFREWAVCDSKARTPLKTQVLGGVLFVE